MSALAVIFAILLAVAALILLLDRTTPSREACLTAVKAVVFAVLTLPVAAWLVASSVFRRAKRKFAGANASFER